MLPLGSVRLASRVSIPSPASISKIGARVFSSVLLSKGVGRKEARPWNASTPLRHLHKRGMMMESPELEELYRGHQKFLTGARETEPQLLKDLARDGQKPPFLFIDCCDSRSNETTIFSAKPGSMFTAGNIANQFHEHDLNSRSILAYAMEHLKVKHIIVMGHYGCGGVAAAMSEPAPHTGVEGDTALNDWIAPIRDLYLTSQRPEIVQHRESKQLGAPTLHDPAFRALVEENVKASVRRLASSKIMSSYYSRFDGVWIQSADDTRGAKPEAEREESPMPVYIHGWVYDIENGQVADLGVTASKGSALISPFPRVKDVSL